MSTARTSGRCPRGLRFCIPRRMTSGACGAVRVVDRHRPVEASSGQVVRHRLSRAGNRRMNHMIHIAATAQIRLDTPGRAYYRRKLAAGKSRREAMRCLKRRISDALYRRLRNDAATTAEAGLGGHSGATHISSAAGLHPHTGTSDQPLPGPAPTTLPAATGRRKTASSRTLQHAP